MSSLTEDYSREYFEGKLDVVLKALLDSAVGVSRVMDHVNKKGETITSVYEIPPNEKSIRLIMQMTNSLSGDNAARRLQLAMAKVHEDSLVTGLNASRVANLESGTRLNSVTEKAYTSTMLDPKDVQEDLTKVVGAAVALLSSKKFNTMQEIMRSRESYENSVKLSLMTFSRLVSDVMGSTSGMPEIRIVDGVVEVLRGDLLIEAYESLGGEVEEQEGDFDDEESEDEQ